MDKTSISKKSWKEYSPFAWEFNFAIKNLAFADFVEYPQRGYLSLTEKDRLVNPYDLNPEKEPIADKVLEKLKNKKSDDITDDEPDEDGDGDTKEELRIKLKKSLLKMSPRKFEIFCRALMNAMKIDLDKEIGLKYVDDDGLDGFGFVTSDDYRTTLKS